MIIKGIRNGKRFIWFGLISDDLGFNIVLTIFGKHFIFNPPIPIELKTLRYSVRYQGWLKSIKTGFYVH